MVGWHHQLSGHEFEQIPGDGEGQGSLTCCSPWGRTESDATEQLNNNNQHNLSCNEVSLGTPSSGRKAEMMTLDDGYEAACCQETAF